MVLEGRTKGRGKGVEVGQQILVRGVEWRTGLSVGVGFELRVFESVLPEPIQIDLAGQFIHLPTIVTLKQNPADAIGDYTAGGWWLGGALTMRLLF